MAFTPINISHIILILTFLKDYSATLKQHSNMLLVRLPRVFLSSVINRQKNNKWQTSKLPRYTPCPEKKGATLLLPVTLRNVNRFSKFFHLHTLQ